MAQEEIIFKISADAGQAEKETASLEHSLEGVNEAAEELMKTNKGLNATFEDIYGDLQPLSGRIGELEDRMYELALANKTNTEEYKELEAEVVKYKQTVLSTDKAVDQLVEQGSGLGAALQIGTAVTAGYGAIQGSMVALGIESESLEKSFVKLQAVQTILASLEQLKLSLDKQSIVVTKAKAAATWVTTIAQTAWTTATAGTTAAMGALKIAMLAIPILAIIAGIVALVTAIASLFTATEEAEEMNKKLTASLEKNREAFERNTAAAQKATENRLKLAKAQGKSIEEIHQLELKNLEQIEKARKNDLKLTLNEISQKREVLKKARSEENWELAKEIVEEIQSNRKKYRDLRLLDNDYYTNREVLILDHNKKLEEEEKKAQEKRNSNWKAAADKRKKQEEDEARKKLERERLLTDLMLNNIEDEELRKLSILQESHKREEAELIKKYGEDTMLLAQLEIKQGEEMTKLTQEIEAKRKAEKDKADKKQLDEDKKLAEQKARDKRAQLEGELIRDREDFELTQKLQKELAELDRDRVLNDTESTEGEKFKVKQEYAQRIAELDKAKADRQLALEAETAQAIKNVYESSFSAISNLSEGIFALRIANAESGSKKELELQKKAFEFNKKMQIAQATIQGIQSVQNAFTTAAASPLTTVFPAYPYIQASAAGVKALGNILKIKATTFQGGGSVGSTSTNPPTVGVPTDVETPEDTTTLTEGLEGAGQSMSVTLVDSQVKQALDESAKVEIISKLG